MLTLDTQVKLYIPSVQKDGTDIIARNALLEDALAFFNELFGGSTMQEATGTYTLDNGGIQLEHVTIIESWCDKQHLFDNLYHANGVLSFARELCIRANQESVLLVVDNKAIFVRPDDLTDKETLQ